jgi:hypothetical protein
MLPIPFASLLLIDTVAVVSSALANVAYDCLRSILQVTFRDGSIYQYLDVPVHVFEDLLRADSKGAYLNSHIRRRFPHRILCAAAIPATD